jgi:hypothetical protein
VINRKLSYLLRMVKTLDYFTLRDIAECRVTFDYTDKAIIAVAKGELDWRRYGQ